MIEVFALVSQERERHEPSYGEQELGHDQICLVVLLQPHVQHGHRLRDRWRLTTSVGSGPLTRLGFTKFGEPVSMCISRGKDVVARVTTYSRLMTGFRAAKSLVDMAVECSLVSASLRRRLDCV